MDDKTQTRKRDRMDGDTAIAFAIECFQKHHTRESCPEWLSRCTSIGYYWDKEDNYIVAFSVTPKVTNDAVRYFEIAIDPSTGKTTVTKDDGVDAFTGEELQGY